MVYYLALGSGFGHLTRACAISYALSIVKINCRIITDSQHGSRFRTTYGVDIVYSRIKDLLGVLRAAKSKLLIIDSFLPNLYTKLPSLKHTPTLLIARHINEQSVAQVVKNTYMLDSIVLIEPTTKEYKSFLKQSCKNFCELEGYVRFPYEQAGFKSEDCELPIIVHSDQKDELKILIEVAKGLAGKEFKVISNVSLPNSKFKFPAYPLFKKAPLIISAAGYNMIAETQEFQNKHISIPMTRRFDDQEFRLENRISCYNNSADAVVNIIKNII